MTEEKLEKAKGLLSLIKHNEKLLNNVKNQKTEWIDFTFGNGSNRSCVCDDLETINEVMNIITVRAKSKISILKEEFQNL